MVSVKKTMAQCDTYGGNSDKRYQQYLQANFLLLTRADKMTPTTTLTDMARSLSVQQLGAYHIAAQVFKIY